MHNPPRILIVEDDGVLIANLQMTILQMGYQVAGLAATGAAAVEIALVQKPDAILMDIRLRGEMNGIQATEQIHQYLDVPVVFLSAFTDELLLQEAKVTDAYAYLAKPIRDRELRASLEMAFYKHSAEERLRYLNQVLRALRDINQVITREHDPRRLLDQVCQILLPTSGHRFVNIFQIEGETVNLLAQAGDDHQLGAQMAAGATPEQFAGLPGVQAFRTRQVVVCQDMITDPRFAPWRENLEKGRFASMVAVPICHDDSLMGVLSVFADQPDRFDPEEVELLEELAGDIAFGLKSIAEESEHRQAEDARRASEARFRAAFMTGLDGFYIATLEEGLIIEVNKEFEGVFGYSREEVIGKTSLELNLYAEPEERARVVADLKARGSVKNLEVKGRKKGGETILCSLSISVMPIDDKPHILGIIRDITISKLAADALRESEERYKLMFEQAPIAINITRGTGIAYANPAYLSMFGYSNLEELKRLAPLDLFTPESRPVILENIQRRDQGLAVPNAYETECLRKDGSRFPIQMYLTRTVFSDGPATLAFILDITDSSRAQEQLHILKYSIDTAPDSAFWMDMQGNFLYVNDAACKSLGYTREELLQMNVRQVNPNVTPLRWSQVNHDIRVQKNFTNQSIHCRKDGSRFPVEINSAYIQFGDQEYINGFARDITERKHAEETLRESEEKYRALVENSIQGVILYQEYRLAYVNPRLCEISGYSFEELVPVLPLHSPDFIHPDDRERVAERTRRFLRGDAVDDRDSFRIIRKDGEVRHVETFSKSLTVEGKPAGIVTMVDVTERNQREQELQAIATLSAALRTAPTRAEMLPVIVDQIAALIRSDTVSIEIIDPFSGDAMVEAAYGSWKSLVGARQAKGKGFNAIVSRTLKPYISQTLEDDPNLADLSYPEWARKDIHATAGMPLVTQEKLIGFIWIGRKIEISNSEIRLLSAIADITANAIQRATSHEQTLQAVAELAMAYDTTLEGWAHALELRDQETEGHARRVVEMTVALARASGIQGLELENVRRGALLHDIGKMGIPDSVLLKPGTLNEREWEIMRRHTEYARDLLMPIEYLRNTVDIPFNHHEKWDGTGYPRGLKDQEIPLAARLFAVADVWDALTSDRPYRKAWPRDQALKFICEQKGRHFDPAVVDLFMDMIEKD